MTTIKTAISIDEEIFKVVETMTKKMHISRSQFYSQAAKYMIDRKENVELLQKINSSFDAVKENADEKSQRKQEKEYHHKRVSSEWK